MVKLPSAIGLALLGTSLVGSSSARAEGTASPLLQPATATTPLLHPPLPAPALKPPRTLWYGWEPLLSAAGVSSLSLALLRSEPLAGLTLGSVLSPLTTMMMHERHGDRGKAYLSLGLSYGMILGGGVLGGSVACGGHGNTSCRTLGALTGILLGGASAVILDASFLAWGAPTPDPPAKKARLWPSVVPLPGGAAVGLGGAF